LGHDPGAKLCPQLCMGWPCELPSRTL